MNGNPKAQASASVVESTIVRLTQDGSAETLRDCVSVEEPLELRRNGQRLIVTMRTPGADEDLVFGYLASEGVIESVDDVLCMERDERASHPENAINVVLKEPCLTRLERLERVGAVASSCGVCGKKTLDTACERLGQIGGNLKTSQEALFRMVDTLRERQSDFRKTGGLHAAGLFSGSGELEILREDIGRHNAVDKVLGAALRMRPWPLQDRMLLVSGRVSFDIAQKSLAAGVPVLAAVSAPSSLAISLAREKGQMLVAFLRRPTLNVYSHPQRMAE